MQKKRKLDKGKVVLGLSGGVDSTAAALLLQEKGYEVIGLYFDVEADVSNGRRRAEIAAEQLGIKFIYRDVSSQFREIVIGNFCSEYMKGRTPNPCIVCNPTVKFQTLIATADDEGAYYIATGHYANTYFEPQFPDNISAEEENSSEGGQKQTVSLDTVIPDEEKGRWYIKKAASERKDQSYMLYRLGQEDISRLLLPLNEIENKEQVRELARGRSMKNAETKDSQEICFIDDYDSYKDFLIRNGYKTPKGNFVDRDGNVLGEHQGILNYTIGQRKGLGLALGKPVFVTKIDSKGNQVVLGENADLFVQEVVSDNNILMGTDLVKQDDSEALAEVKKQAISMGFTGLTAKIRYAAKPAAATIELLEDGKILTRFQEPQRAVTPGQSIVFYRDDIVIGGGFIV